MKVSLIAAQVGLGMLGAAALLGAVAPVRAQGSSAPPPTSVEGLVTGATDTTLTIHSPFSGVEDVVLTVNSNTHFRKAGGETDTPDEMPPSGVPAVQTPS